MRELDPRSPMGTIPGHRPDRAERTASERRDRTDRMPTSRTALGAEGAALTPVMGQALGSRAGAALEGGEHR